MSLRIALLGARHARILEFSHPGVDRYDIEGPSAAGHGDWRFDEIRLAGNGRIVHEIEWWNGPSPGGRWIIEAADIVASSRPVGGGQGVPAR